jgi:hypothetical protein
MSERTDHDGPPAASNRQKRERSTRYPGVGLAESLKLCESVDNLGLDGLSAPAIASALGYKNIKTNTFSARLSAARQFGLMILTDEGYALTPLARTILHPVEPAEIPKLYRQALLKPPLYAELAERLAGKRVPDAEILGNVLYHNHQIIATAKQQAAEAFLESARFAGALGADQIFHPEGPPAPAPAPLPSAAPLASPGMSGPAPSLPAGSAPPRAVPAEVRIDLQLWDEDEGKLIRVRAPKTISAASFERLLQTFRLLVRIKD